MSAARDAWRAWPPERLEREYSPSSRLGGDYTPYVREWIRGGELARATLELRADLRYGPGPGDLLDLFPVARSGGRGAPLVLFVHGGYWQELGKADSHYPAPGLVADGIAFAALEYEIAPAGTIAGMADQTIRALRWLRAEGAALGVDPERIVVAGHSAGAHLASLALLDDARGGGGTGLPPIRGGLLVSGVYDLEPLVGTSINAPLGLDAPTARALSPLGLVEALPASERRLGPVVVTWGENETGEFARQSRELAATWAAHLRPGATVESFEVPARNHFDIVLEIGDGATAVGAATRRLIGIDRAGRSGGSAERVGP